MPRGPSAHNPIILSCGTWTGKRSYFKFENMWLKEDGFVVMVQQWWNSINVVGSASFVLANKLKPLQDKLKLWNVETFGNLNSRLMQVQNRLTDFKLLEESVGHSDDDKICRDK